MYFKFVWPFYLPCKVIPYFIISYNRRKLEELPYLTFKLNGTAVKYSLDADWIFEKICGSSVHQVVCLINMYD